MLKYIFEITTVVLISVVLVASAEPAHAQKTSLIRDAEIENTIRQFAAPVLRAAKLNEKAVKIHLVLDDSLNAFVAGGQRLFINTGLITHSASAGQIIGVIAHETGHISGGHLARLHDALNKSSATTIMSMLLGVTAIVAGRGDVGTMIIAAGQGISASNFLKYSRTQESAADHAALRFLDDTSQSAKGLLDFMKKLGEQELLVTARQDPYVRTHPLTRNRVATIANHVAKSPHSDNPVPQKLENLFQRARAKIIGYFMPLGHTLRIYIQKDKSQAARYARAIGYFRKSDFNKAIALMDELIAEFPRDPYFWEMKGQMTFESGDAKGAIKPYQTAVSLLPGNALIRRDLGRVQLELNDPALLNDAIVNLRAATIEDPESPFTWRQLAIAYGRQGDKGHSSLALAEEALLLGKKSIARYHGGLAERLFPKGSREWLHAQDILTAARHKKK